MTVFGGTGYLGRSVVRKLVETGARVRIAVRRPRAELFQGAGHAIEHVRADITDQASVAVAVRGAAGVINAVSLYVESGAATFSAVHVDGARNVAEKSAAVGARLVHVSGIGSDPDSVSRYVAARAQGEEVVSTAAPGAVIIRPSVLFGCDDVFLDSLCRLVRFLPVIPLFGSGRTRLQPVNVADVAGAAARLVMAEPGRCKIYELGGPRIYTYRELLQTIASHIGRRRLFVSVPFPVWKMIAAACTLLPDPPLTRDQVVLMSRDNVVDPAQGTFSQLGIEPAALENTLSRRQGTM